MAMPTAPVLLRLACRRVRRALTLGCACRADLSQMQRLIFAGLIATAAGFSHGVALPRSKLVRSPALVMEEKAAAPPAKAAEGEEAEEPAPPPPPPPPEYAESLPFLVKRKQLKGYVGSNGERVFRGVPYAQPPTGELRFRPPKNKTARFETRTKLASSGCCMLFGLGILVGACVGVAVFSTFVVTLRRRFPGSEKRLPRLFVEQAALDDEGRGAAARRWVAEDVAAHETHHGLCVSVPSDVHHAQRAPSPLPRRRQ